MNIRPAEPTDAAEMTAILNEIIEIGGTTAHQTPFDEKRMINDYIASDDLISCHIAEENGQVIGFQWLGWPDPDDDKTPRGWAIIASFVAVQAVGKGTGKHLFKATVEAAKQAGVATIDATIRADNVSGLRFYSGVGFVDYDRQRDVLLSDGQVIDKVRKRFEVG